MRDKGFDQLPVLASAGGKLVGLVTLGNLLSYMSRGRASGQTPIREIMFDFSSIPEILTDPQDIDVQAHFSTANGLDEEPNSVQSRTSKRRRRFVKITMDTPLLALSKFFEWNSAAVVTDDGNFKDGDLPKPVAVVTKVDLLTWLMRQHNPL